MHETLFSAIALYFTTTLGRPAYQAYKSHVFCCACILVHAQLMCSSFVGSPRRPARTQWPHECRVALRHGSVNARTDAVHKPWQSHRADHNVCRVNAGTRGATMSQLIAPVSREHGHTTGQRLTKVTNMVGAMGDRIDSAVESYPAEPQPAEDTSPVDVEPSQMSAEFPTLINYDFADRGSAEGLRRHDIRGPGGPWRCLPLRD